MAYVNEILSDGMYKMHVMHFHECYFKSLIERAIKNRYWAIWRSIELSAESKFLHIGLFIHGIINVWIMKTIQNRQTNCNILLKNIMHMARSHFLSLLFLTFVSKSKKLTICQTVLKTNVTNKFFRNIKNYLLRKLLNKTLFFCINKINEKKNNIGLKKWCARNEKQRTK